MSKRIERVPLRFLFMAVLMGCLLGGTGLAQDEGKRAEGADLRPDVEKWVGRQAMGIYMFGKKIGYCVIDISVEDFAGTPALQQSFEAEMRIKMFGETSTMSSKEVNWFALEGEGPLLAIETVETEDGTTTREFLRQGEDGWEIVTQVGERVQRRPVAEPKATLAEELAIDRWLEGEPDKGAARDLWMIELDQEDINQQETLEYLGTERRLQSGVAQKVHTVKMKMDGLAATVKFVNQKVFVEATVGKVMRMVAEEEPIARRMDTKIDDITLHMSVPIKKDLGDDPGRIEKLRAEVRGLGDFALPQTHRQRVEIREGKAPLVELQRDFRVKEGKALAEEERVRLTAAQPGIESDHELIRGQSRQVIGGEKDPVEQARLLQHWIYQNLEATAAKNASSALTILEQKAGDCSEHARLFVAMARSVGLPAREITGLLYSKFEKPLFGWHMWAEIHDGRQWVSVDPAWDQVFVDASHIRFGDGFDDLAWVSTIGSLKIRVKDFETE